MGSAASLAPAPAGEAALVAWLAGDGPLPAAETLRAASVAAYAYARLPASHAGRAALRGDFLAVVDLQLRVRAELARLVAAWRAAGIEVLLFKGFAMAELFYPSAGWRTFGDVDVLVPPEDAPRAETIARELGWRSDRFVGSPLPLGTHSHCELTGPGGVARVDLHRLPIPAVAYRPPGPRSPQAAITRAVWAASQERPWSPAGEGITVRTLSPVDAALVGIVLQRAWGGDRWGVRPRDLADWRLLAERYGVTRAALEARARELGCRATLAAFLARWDEGVRSGSFPLPTPRELRRLDRVARPEHGTLAARERWLYRAHVWPRMLSEAASVLPDVWRARRALARERDVRALLASLDETPARGKGDAATLLHTCRGVHVAMRLVRYREAGPCLFAALTLYAALRRRGFAPRFVSGVRRGPGGIVGHAWVELGDELLDPVGMAGRVEYVVSLRHPGPGTR